MKFHLANFIELLLIIIIVFALWHFFSQPFFLIPGIIIITMFVVSELFFFFNLNNYYFSIEKKPVCTEINNNVKFGCACINKGLFPINKCVLSYRLSNLYCPNNKKYKASFFSFFKNASEYSFSVKADFPGMLVFEPFMLEVYDLFGIFSKKITINENVSVAVLPNENFPTFSIPMNESEGEEETATNSFHSMLSSDIKDIREYRPGDRIQHIHWNISAKMDDFFIKVLETTTSVSVVVIPYINILNIFDSCTNLFGVISILRKSDVNYQIALLNPATREFIFQKITDDESVLNLFIQLYKLPLADTSEDIYSIYCSQGYNNNNILIIDGNDIKDLSEN